MAQEDSRYPELSVPTLGGLNERPSPANLRPGEFDVLEGFYPAHIGLLRRVPGKTLLATLTGKVLQIYPTYNINGDVLVQTTTGLYCYTLDELRGRAVAPNIVFIPPPEEESMSLAIIVQKESNGTAGGSALGQQSGTDNTSLLKTFYARRLTDMLVNEGGLVTTFAGSTGGGASASAAGTFTLSPGLYRISVSATYVLSGDFQVIFGLYNNTTAAFEVQTGTSTPIMATVIAAPGSSGNIMTGMLEGSVTVASTNKTFQISHAATTTGGAQTTNLCGKPFASTTPTVNGSAPTETYCVVKILKVS